MSRMCSISNPADLIGAVMNMAAKKQGVSDEDETAAPNPERWWTREKQTKGASSTLQNSTDLGQTGSDRPRRSGLKKNDRPISSIRQRNFGALGGPEDAAGYVSGNKDVPLDNTDETPKTVRVREMPSKDGDPKKSWKMTLPANFFAESEEWGRLRDARVHFEPDRIIVEAHDRLGHSKIIHCSNIPRRLDAEASTYKLDPDGKNVQLTLHTVKSPRSDEEIIAEAKEKNEKDNEKPERAKDGDAPAPFIIKPEKFAGKLYQSDAPTKPSHFL